MGWNGLKAAEDRWKIVNKNLKPQQKNTNKKQHLCLTDQKYQKQPTYEVYARKNKLVPCVVFVYNWQYIMRSRKSDVARVPDP